MPVRGPMRDDPFITHVPPRNGQDNTNSPPHPCVNATGHRPQNAVEIVPVMVKRGSTMKELPFALRPPLAP